MICSVYHNKVQEIRAQFECMSNSANSGCGLVYELYIDRLSSSALRYIRSLTGEYRLIATCIATSHYDCLSKEELIASRRDAHRDGLCKHYFEYDECPCGCGELDAADRVNEDREMRDTEDRFLGRFPGLHKECIHRNLTWLCKECKKPYDLLAREQADQDSIALMKGLKAQRDAFPESWQWCIAAHRKAIDLLFDLRLQIEQKCPEIDLSRITREDQPADEVALWHARYLCRSVTDILTEGQVSWSGKNIIR